VLVSPLYKRGARGDFQQAQRKSERISGRFLNPSHPSLINVRSKFSLYKREIKRDLIGGSKSKGSFGHNGS